MFNAEIERLQMAAAAEVPQVELMAVFAAGQQVEVRPVLDHVGRAPFAGDGDVVAEMPPEIVTKELGAAIDLPAAEHVEAFVIEQEDAAGSVALRIAERADVDG